MFHSFSKKIIVLTLIFTLVTSLFLPLLPVGVFAEDSDFCNQVKNATCDDDLKSLSEDSRLKDCGGSIQSGLLTLVNKCKADLDKQKAQTESQLKNLEKQQSTAEKTLNNLTWNIKKLNTEIASLNLSLAELENAIQEREKAIKELDDALGQHKAILSEAIRQIYEYNTLSYIEMLLGYRTLSDFNQKLEEIDRLQKSLKSSMEEIRKAKEQMEKEKEELTQKKKEQEQYKAMQEMSKQSLALKQEQQQYLIEKLAVAKTPLEKEMARIEAELMNLRAAMDQIQNYLFRALGYYVTAEDIFNAVKIASDQTGVAPEILLAILQTEGSVNKELYNKGSREANIQQCVDFCEPANCTKKGYNTDGTRCWFFKCTYFDQPQTERLNWCTAQQNALERICNRLEINPNDPKKVRITRDYGMGPAQIEPTTYESNKFTGNPWNLNWAVWAIGKLYPGGYAYVGSSSFQSRVQEWQSVISVCGFSLTCPDLKSKLEKQFSAQ